MPIPVPDMLYRGTLKHQMIFIPNCKATLSMALWTITLEPWDALAAPNIIRQVVATTPKTQKRFHSRGRNLYLGNMTG